VCVVFVIGVYANGGFMCVWCVCYTGVVWFMLFIRILYIVILCVF